jgi:hypothetical protein
MYLDLYPTTEVSCIVGDWLLKFQKTTKPLNQTNEPTQDVQMHPTYGAPAR